MDKPDEMVLYEKIKKGNIKAFETLFHRYYGNLCLFASKLINNNEAAEEIVQDLFVKLWEKKEQISIESSIKNYLFRSVKNHCLNFIKHNKIKEKFVRDSTFDFDSDSGADSYFAEIDLAKKIEESIQSLPEKRGEIFRLNRKEGLKYREIAEKLNLSIKTVEAQMGLAIKSLREKLKDYYPFLFLISFFK